MNDQNGLVQHWDTTAIDRIREVAAREAECPSSAGLFSTARYFEHAKESGVLQTVGHRDPLSNPPEKGRLVMTNGKRLCKPPFFDVVQAENEVAPP